MNHNQIDSSIMSRILGMPVLKKDFTLEEDRDKHLADGVIWRRRRFRFYVPREDDPSQERSEGLCINEVTLDSDATAEMGPVLAAEYPHLVDFSEIENAYWATSFASGAIRRKDGQKESRFYLNLAPLFYGHEDDTTGPARKIMEAEAQGRGVLERQRVFEAFDPHYVDKGTEEFGLVRYLPAFPASRLVQASEDILAATNAGYFLNFPEEYDDGISALHQPLGGHMIDGRLVMPPWVERPGVLHFEEGTSLPGLYGPDDMELHIEGLTPVRLHRGKNSRDARGAVWRHFDGQPTPPPRNSVVLAFTGAVLTRVANGDKPIKPPFGGALVYLTGEHAQAAASEDFPQRVSLHLRPFDQGPPNWMVSSGPFLVKNSKAVDPEQMLTPPFAGEFRPDGPAPTRFPFNTAETRAPRTAFGVLPSGGLKIVVVDGRHSGEHSCGLTLAGISNLMQWVGCDTAINFDGGGSSVMAIEGADHADMLRENSPHGVVNIPSDDGGNERIVPVFLAVRSRSQ